MTASLRFALALFASSGALAACDAAKVAEECVAADLVGQCPAGSNPVLGAVAGSTCGGEFNANVVTEEGSATGQCNSNGSCEFLCQFEVPCSCGVATLSKETIVCSECQDQSCGDGRCEGTERATCEAGQQGCFACAEDCAGPTCGDGDCTGTENPDNCPQDCADRCVPNSASCVGSRVVNCSADGKTTAEFDCATVGQVCSGGACVAPNVCGNGVCDGTESTASCAADCSGLCTPSSRRCEANTLVVCSADGKSENETDCGDQICANGQCRQPDVCGNSVCEAGEAAGCPQDCAAVCGNDICENNEQTACPADCTTCGNSVCEAGEINTCPQDCGVCVPSEKQCLGKILRVCNANGTAYDDIDCDDFELSCGGGNCVEPDVCGNGVCEADENLAVCAIDCTEVCGNGTCGAGESFQTCSTDCDPICGDGRCEGNETNASCSFDCLASCGDGTCTGFEGRDNCPGDCGFCGDGTCQDGAESANANPTGGLTSCVVDCVATTCDEDDDCDDDVSCTANQCRNGACIYTPNDDLCVGDDKCIRLNGCCADGDGDGYAASSCGGSDCNDDDPNIHPGAIEVCGGGDRNCNGTHKPALLPAKKLTNTTSFKKNMSAQDTGESFVLAWTGKAAVVQHLEMLDVGWDLLPKGAVATIDAIEVNEQLPHVSIAWNEAQQKFGAAWIQGPYIGQGPGQPSSFGMIWNTSVAWLSKGGVIEGTPYVEESWMYPTGAVARGNTVIFPTQTQYTNYPQYTFGGPLYELTPAGNTPVMRVIPEATMPNYADSIIAPVVSGGVVAGLRMVNLRTQPPVRGDFVIFDVNGAAVSGIAATLEHSSAAGDCVIGEDGALLVVVCGHNSRTYYHRVTQAGGLFQTAEVTTSGGQKPLAVGKSKPRGDADPLVGAALSDATGNLWFFVRDIEGAAVLAPAIIGNADTIGSAHVLHDGTDFIVVWLAKTGSVEQAYAQRITCE